MDRLADVFGLDAFHPYEVGDRAGDLEDAVVGAGAELEVLHRVAEHLLGGGIERAELLDLGVTHPGIAGGFASAAEPVGLPSAGPDNTLADRERRLGWLVTGEVAVVDGGSFDMEVEPYCRTSMNDSRTNSRSTGAV